MTNKERRDFKPYNLVLFNDPMHSFEYVLDVLTTTMGFDKQTAAKHAMMIHYNQKSILYSGLLEHVEHYAEMIENFEGERKDGSILPSLAVEVERNN